MTTLEVTVTLPENVAREAEANGLLALEAMERLLREELRRRQVEGLFAAADRLAAGAAPPLTPSEVEVEIAAARAEKRTAHARRN
jgi:hypothetical protein